MNPVPYNILSALQAVRGLLSVSQVAEMFGKSRATIYRMAQKRQIPSIMLGGSRMFDPSTLVLWLTRKEPLLAVAARQFQQAAKSDATISKMETVQPGTAGQSRAPSDRSRSTGCSETSMTHPGLIRDSSDHSPESSDGMLRKSRQA
jgi:excisionase family DNA binding protein